MKTLAFLFVIFLFNFNTFSQNKKYYDSETIESIERSYNNVITDRVLDSLWVNNKVYYFKENPMDFLKDAINVVYENVLVIPVLDKGYTLEWSLINNKLYISDINIYRSDYVTNLKPKKEESLTKIEDFLGRKFDETGLLADFATGKFMLYKYPLTINKPSEKKDKYTDEEHKQYRKFVKKKQEIYSLELKNGKLIKFSRDKIIERKFKRDFDINAIVGSGW